MDRRFAVAATLAQVTALIAVLYGLYLLLGLASTLIIGGALVLVGSVAVEMLAGRAAVREKGRR